MPKYNSPVKRLSEKDLGAEVIISFRPNSNFVKNDIVFRQLLSGEVFLRGGKISGLYGEGFEIRRNVYIGNELISTRTERIPYTDVLKMRIESPILENYNKGSPTNAVIKPAETKAGLEDEVAVEEPGKEDLKKIEEEPKK